MIRLGAQPLHRACGGLVDAICSSSTQACALIDGAGRVVSSSPLFRAVADREPGLGEFLASVPGCNGGTEGWLDDGWLVGRASPVVGSVLSLLHLFGPAVARARVARFYRTQLSAREGQCLALAIEGAENGAIASRLGVRPETVKVHLRNAYRKLGAGGRAEILARLVEAP